MMDNHKALAQALFALERELRELDLWQSQQPPVSALASTQPFAVDTLEFYQWLQFLFIPRLMRLVEHRSPLPDTCAVAPMAEEFFHPRAETGEEVIAVLERIDWLITEAGGTEPGK